MTTYIIAGGCFWCLDAVYRQLNGVSEVVSGYTGGKTINPTYDEVSGGNSGHAEAVKISFDESTIPSNVILDIFFLIHDPTTLNRQGHDVGTQYRSAMYFSDQLQKTVFESAMERAKAHRGDTLTTELSELDHFYPAEDYHQDYFNNNPGNGYCSIVITPKIVKARSTYVSWFKNE
jgi:peptide-methionine (S)-S-oxide reductase